MSAQAPLARSWGRKSARHVKGVLAFQGHEFRVGDHSHAEPRNPAKARVLPLKGPIQLTVYDLAAFYIYLSFYAVYLCMSKHPPSSKFT